MRTCWTVSSVALCLLWTPAAAGAQETPHFDARPVLDCLAAAGTMPERRACIGAAASACMNDDLGYTTVGMGYCYDQERGLWDVWLNAAYGRLMEREKAYDAEMTSAGVTAPSAAAALREMQRACIPYRDAACDYERSRWGNGTGAGPATLACLMQHTGEQALALDARMAPQ